MKIKGIVKLLALSMVSIVTLSSVTLASLDTKALEARANIDNYYRSVDTNLKGQPFIDDLSNVINNGAKIGSYSDAYKRLCDTDEDPNNSNNIVCFYTGVSYPKGKSGKDRNWNREHVWAKSHGFPSEGMKAHCDIHHLRATEMKINSTRSNMDFDEVENHKGTVKSDKYGNKWISNMCFEPRDEVKGDVARMMFYMVTMYNGHSGTSLELHNKIPSNNKSTGHGEFGGLNTLIKWHQEDPVDNVERRRNEVIYGYQNNRNPYIDHPEYVANAFNVDIVLPDEPDKPVGPDINKYNVELVISMIDTIPNEITLNDEVTILNAKAVYDTLNEAEKKLVSNYNKLKNALDKLEELKNPDLKPKPDPDINDSLDVSATINMSGSSLENHAYMPGYRFNLDGYSFEASYAGVTNGELRLGDNKSRAIPGKYEIDKYGVALEFNFNVKNLTSFGFDIVNKYGGLYKYHLFIEENGRLRRLNGGIINNKNAKGSYEIKLDEAVSGKLHLVFEGKECRVVLGDIRLSINDDIITPEPPKPDTSIEDSFIKETAKSRLDVTYNTFSKELVDLKLHLGGKIKKDSYDKVSKYGIIIVDSNITLNPGLLDNDKFNSYNHKEIRPQQEDPQGNIFMIDYELDLNDFSKEINVAMYIERNGKIYLSIPAKISINSTIEKYINNSSIVNNPKYKDAIESLRKYLNR